MKFLHLRGLEAGKQMGAGAAGEAERHRDGHVHLGDPAGRLHPVRLAIDPASEADRVGADVEKRPSAEVGVEPDVARFSKREAEAGPDLLRRLLAERPDDILDARVEAVHHGLHQEPTARMRRRRHLDRLGCADGEGLLAEDVLAGRQRPDRPLPVECVGKR